jgi:hypothetical protein
MAVLVTLIHAGVGAVWLGSMAYSLGIVQPRIGRLFGDPARAEDVYRELAAGNRWRVVVLIVVLVGSGAGLAALAGADGGGASDRAAGSTAGSAGNGAGGGRDTWWWALIATKAVLAVAAAACFWWVSWRGWPARVFALPAELPALHRRFRRVALVMTAFVGAAFVLGIVAAHA